MAQGAAEIRRIAVVPARADAGVGGDALTIGWVE